jgi:hypothetical protein
LRGKGRDILFGGTVSPLCGCVEVSAEIIDLLEDFILVKFVDVLFADDEQNRQHNGFRLIVW